MSVTNGADVRPQPVKNKVHENFGRRASSSAPNGAVQVSYQQVSRDKMSFAYPRGRNQDPVAVDTNGQLPPVATTSSLPYRLRPVFEICRLGVLSMAELGGRPLFWGIVSSSQP